MRELVKLSRVSQLWRTLVFDGQLWQNVDLKAFPMTSSAFFASIVQLSGSFVKGQACLSPPALIDMAGGLCMRSAPISNYTQLTAITLQGCASFTTQSLHSLLVRSNTSISGSVRKEFVQLACERSMRDTELVIVDCQSVGKLAIEGVVDTMCPRKGRRSWEAMKLGDLDGRDEEDLKVGQDGCEEKRVVIKSVYSWQIVDDVRE